MGPFWKHLKSWSLQITAISARSLYCDMLHPTGTAASESCPTSSDDSDEGKQANHQHCACHAPAKLWKCTWGLMILHRALVWNNGCAITSTYNDTDKSSTHEYCHQRSKDGDGESQQPFCGKTFLRGLHGMYIWNSRCLSHFGASRQ